jgi:erythromycin esterase
LSKNRYEEELKKVVLVGFGTYKGTVIAAKEWGEKMERMDVPPAVNGSWDNLIHKQSNGSNILLIFRDDSERNTKGEILTEEAKAKE